MSAPRSPGGASAPRVPGAEGRAAEGRLRVRLPPWRLAFQGGLLFLVLAAIGLAAAVWMDREGVGLRALQGTIRDAPAAAFAGLAGVVALDVILGALRLHVLARALVPRASLRLAVRAYLVNIFAAAVTPLQAGAGPAQLFVLTRGGVPLGPALAVLLLNFAGILTALLGLAASGALVLLAGRADGPTGGAVSALLLGTVALGGLLLAALAAPSLGLRLARGLGRLPRAAGLSARLAGALAEYRAAAAVLARRHRAAWAANVALSALLVLNKATAAFLVLIVLGAAAPYGEVAARQVLQFPIIYFGASPGGSGIAEATAPAFMAGLIPAGRFFEFALLWRMTTSYLGVVLGGLATLATLLRQPREGRP